MWLEHLATAGLSVVAMMTMVWMLGVKLRNASIIDIFWGLGFVSLGWLYFVMTDGFELRRWLVLGLVTLWGLRLALYISVRNHGKGEDKRYATWRREGGKWWWLRSYVTVFLLQGLMMLVISIPLYLSQRSVLPDSLTAIDSIAVFVALAGILFEAVADWQLFHFKRDSANRGQVLSSGLWRYSRHPNYFGEILVWWGLFGLAVQTPSGWLALISPVLMTVLLMKVSGVTLLESGLKKSKPGYEDYVRRTNALIPWRPKTS